MRAVLVALLAILLFACSQNNNKSDSKEDLTAKIAAYEDTLYNQDKFAYLNDDLVNRAIDAYNQFAKDYPKDEMSPEYLFKSANLYRYKRKFFEALAVYQNIESSYPKFDKAPQSLFLQAFIYENELTDLVKAKELYEVFIEKYPDDPFVKDAQHCLDNLGRPLEDIIQDFENADATEEDAES